MLENMYLILLVLFMIQVIAESISAINYQIREIIPPQLAFSDNSDMTVITIMCGEQQIQYSQRKQKSYIRNTILSLFYYNTYPLKQIITVDRCSQGQISENYLRNILPQQNGFRKDKIRYIQSDNGFISILTKAFQNVKTKYIYLLPQKWVTYDGFGFIQQAIDVLQYSKHNDIKISQITQLYPTWGQYRHLGKRMKTNCGTSFHEIKTFKPSQRYYITLNPNVLNFSYIYLNVLGKDPKSFSQMINCGQDRECFEKELGNQLYKRRGYFQVYIDTGSNSANVFKLP